MVVAIVAPRLPPGTRSAPGYGRRTSSSVAPQRSMRGRTPTAYAAVRPTTVAIFGGVHRRDRARVAPGWNREVRDEVRSGPAGAGSSVPVRALTGQAAGPARLPRAAGAGSRSVRRSTNPRLEQQQPPAQLPFTLSWKPGGRRCGTARSRSPWPQNRGPECPGGPVGVRQSRAAIRAAAAGAQQEQGAYVALLAEVCSGASTRWSCSDAGHGGGADAWDRCGPSRLPFGRVRFRPP